MKKIVRLMFGAAILVESASGHAASPPPVRADHTMVVTSHHLASAVGEEILKQGGNAVDAAVAVGYALAVTEPCCGNIGGGGFSVLHLATGQDVFFNFREKAPGSASEAMYLDANGDVRPNLSLEGFLAAGIPGTVLGLDTMLTKYGTLPRHIVMQPAINLAETGFILDDEDAELMMKSYSSFLAQANVAAIFLNHGRPWRSGDLFVQRDLARTLTLIAQSGPTAFYNGAIAQAMVAASHDHGGVFDLRDFDNYAVSESQPLRCSYRGYTILSAPPPSSGGTAICEILNVLEGYPISDWGFHSARSLHYIIEAMRQSFVDRNSLLGDPNFVNNPVQHLLDKAYAGKIRDRLNPDHASHSSEIRPAELTHEGNQTTHYSIVDGAGNAVAVTYTINDWFGAKVIAGDTGFFLNDEMDDFTVKAGAPNLFGLVQGSTNAIAPGKQPLSSMSPTIVLKGNEIRLVLGSPGGSRIITTTLETLMNVIDYGMDIQQAVDAPRIHHQWLPDKVYVEPFAISPDTQALLTAQGYVVEQQPPWGASEAIEVHSKTGDHEASPGNEPAPERPIELLGASDNRRPGGAAIGF
jgi:gamma-glutamyltranspeptidase/glutathione hydrolase